MVPPAVLYKSSHIQHFAKKKLGGCSWYLPSTSIFFPSREYFMQLLKEGCRHIVPDILTNRSQIFCGHQLDEITPSSRQSDFIIETDPLWGAVHLFQDPHSFFTLEGSSWRRCLNLWGHCTLLLNTFEHNQMPSWWEPMMDVWLFSPQDKLKKLHHCLTEGFFFKSLQSTDVIFHRTRNLLQIHHFPD